MKQRLGIAAAILEMPDLIILDEPANALDMSGVENVEKNYSEEREEGHWLFFRVMMQSCYRKCQM